jgi:hypothetical protein
MISKKNLLGNAFPDEGAALGDAELLFICLPVAIGAPCGFLFGLLAPFAVPHIQDGSPLFDCHSSPYAPVVRTLLSPLGLTIGHALADKFSQVSARDILLRCQLIAILLILFAQRAIAQGRRRAGLRHAAIAGRQQQSE